MFWIDMPSEELNGAPARALFDAAVAGNGIVAVALDLSVRPNVT